MFNVNGIAFLINISLLFHYLITSITSQETNRSNFTFDTEPLTLQGKYSSKLHYYDGYIDDKVNDKLYLKIKLLPTNVDNYAFIYISSKENEPTYNNSDYKSIEPESFILVPQSYFQNKTRIVIAVEGKESLDYNITVQGVNDVYLEDGLGVDFVLSPSTLYTFKYNLTHETNNSIMFTTLGPNIIEPALQVFYGDKEFTPKQIFDNGKGIMIRKTDYTYSPSKEFTIKIKINVTSLMQIGVKEVSIDNTPLTIRPRDQEVIIMDNKSVKQICYYIHALDKSPTGSDNRKYIVNAKSYTQNAYYYVYDTTLQQEIKGVAIITSGYMLFDYNDKYTLCIKPTDGSLSEVSTTFQIMDMELLTEYQPYHEALIRGVAHEAYLPKGTVMYYRIPSISLLSKQIEMNIHFIKGTPIMYKGYCTSYPNCYFTPDDITTLINSGDISTAHDVNENIFLIEQLKTNSIYKQPYQPVAIVYCPITSVDCVFDITIQCDGDMTSLLPETRVNRPILQTGRDVYTFEITNDSVQQVNIVLYSFSGNADLTVANDMYFDNEVGEYTANGNREVVTLMRPDGGSLLGKYYIEVSAMKNVYYSVFYYQIYDNTIDNAYTIPPGEMFMETISKATRSKVVYMHNKVVENKTPFLISITSINCNINATIKNKTYSGKEHQVIIQPTDKEYDSGLYKVQIDFVAFDSESSSEKELCMFYIVGDESVNDKEILINEGTYYSMMFNKDVNHLKFIYPFVYAQRHEGITFSFKKQTDINVRLHYNFQGRAHKEVLICEMHRKIRIEITELDEMCSYGEPCPLTISIEPEYIITDKKTNIRFQIEILASEGVPSYLTLGEIRYSKLTYVPHYYYSDLAQGKQTELVVDFLHGSGKAISRVVKKDAPADTWANWNKRVRLPEEDMNDVMHLDYYHKKITIEQNKLNECVNGCELYVKVYPEEYSGEFEIDDYSIIFKQYNTIIELDVNEIVSNIIRNTVMVSPETAYDYYKVTIHKDTDRVVFDVNCDLCVVLINLGTDKTPTIDNADWKFDRNVKMFSISESDSLLKGKKLKGQTFTIAITAIAVDGISGCYYDMKVLSPDRAVDIIHPITSSHEQVCDIKKDLGKCYLLYAIQANDNYKDVFIYVINENLNSTAVELFAKFFDLKDFDAMSPEVKIQNFPSFVYNDYTSSTTTTPFLLHVPITITNTDRYLAVTVHSQKKCSLKVISAYYITPIVSSFRPHSNELYVLRTADSVEIILRGYEHYHTEFVCLLGEIEISNTKDNETTLLNYARNPGIGYIVEPSKEFTTFVITATYTHELTLFYTKYTPIAPMGKFIKLNYGKQNYLEYHQGNPFPIEYYAPIKDESNDIAINLNFKQYIKTDTINGNEGIKLSAHIVSEEFIIERNSNNTDEPHYDMGCKTRYIESLRMGKFLCSKELFAQMNSTGMKYIYLHIEPEISNIHRYSKISTSISLVPSGVSFITLPINEYHHTTIPEEMNMMVFQLEKQSIEHHVMEIELSCDGEWNYTVNKGDRFIDAINYTRSNDEIDLLFFNESNGKYLLRFNINTSHTIHFAFFKTVSKAYDILIKYRTSQNEIEHFTLKSPSIQIQTTKQFMNVTVDAIFHNTLFLIHDASYTLQIFNAEQFESIKEVNVLYPKYTPIVQYSNFTSKNRVVTFSNIPYDLRDYIYVNVLVTGRDGYTNEMLLYDTVMIESKGSSVIWKILLTVVFVGIVGAIGYYIYVSYFKKKCSKNNTYDQVEDFNAKINVDEI